MVKNMKKAGLPFIPTQSVLKLTFAVNGYALIINN
jgi:hypothetical protein